MYIKQIQIRNYRGIRSGAVLLRRGVNCLIGPGNVGKSTVLSAIDLVLNPHLQWWQRSVLTELDFFKSNTNEPIRIDLIVGCGRSSCIAPDKCPRFEITDGNDSRTCPFAEYTLAWDETERKPLKAEEAQARQDAERGGAGVRP